MFIHVLEENSKNSESKKPRSAASAEPINSFAFVEKKKCTILAVRSRIFVEAQV